MSQTDPFDPQAYGLLSHYGEEARFEIKTRMLDDWHESNIKLPSYMKGVARTIQNTGVPEEWLAKLSHQTMTKLLASQTVPRHPVWACLHLYLIQKHGPIGIEPSVTDADILGQSVTRFAQTYSLEDMMGEHQEGPHTELSLNKAEATGYAYASLQETRAPETKFDTPITYRLEGIAIRIAEPADQPLQLVLRNVEDRALHMRAFKLDDRGSDAD